MNINLNLFDYMLCMYYEGSQRILSLLNPDSITDFEKAKIK